MTEAAELFSFLSRLTDTREVITRDIEAEKFVRHLDVKDGKIAGVKLFQSVDEKNREIILSINKPEFSPCPPLTENLEGWFSEAYKDFHEDDIRPKPRRVFKTDSGEVSKFFMDSDKRAREFAEWKKARIRWRQLEREKETRHTIFDDLYRVYEKLKADESYELYVGNGNFFSGLTAGVNYPLILRRATLRYNNGFMELIDLAEDTVFSEEIFKGLEIIAEERIIRARKEVRRARTHPIDTEFGNRLLINLAKILHPNCRYSKEGLYILPTDWFILYEKPILFIRKKRNNAKVFLSKLAEYYAKETEDNKLPLPLADFFTPAKKEPGNAKNVILPMQESVAQEKALEALISSALVAVDAPPGTGKTHSVINFLTYFLSEGKKILVTGAKKEVLRRFAQNLPAYLKTLTVSYRKNDRLELENAVIALANRIEAEDMHILRDKIKTLEERRSVKEERVKEFRKKLKAIEKNERKPDAFKFEGENYSLSAMARYLSENENLLKLIPGSVKAGTSFNLTAEELSMLYESNKVFTPQILSEMTEPLPKSENLLAPFEFDDLLKSRKRLLDKERGLLMELPEWSVEGETILYRGEVIAENIDRYSFEAAERAYSTLDFEWLKTPWAREAVLAGRTGGEAKEAYIELARAAEDVKSAKDSATLLLLGNKVHIEEDLVYDKRVISDLEKMGEIFKNHGHIPLHYKIFNRRFNTILEGITVNKYPITSELDVEIALMGLTLKRARARLENIWHELMVSQGEPPYEELAKDINDIDEIVALRVREINYAIEWYDKKRGEFVELLKEAGINTNKIIPEVDPFTTPRQQLAEEINWLLNVWPSFSELLRLVAIEKGKYFEIMEKHKSALVNRSSKIAKRMLFALGSEDSEGYKKEYEQLLKYESLSDIYEKRADLLSRLAKVAPDYAAVIATQKNGGAVTEKPKNILKAYQARQFAVELEKCENLDFTAESAEDFKLNEEYLKNIIFAKFLERIEKKGLKPSLLRLSKAIQNSMDDKRRNKLNERERDMFTENLPLWILSMEDIFASDFDFSDKFDIIFIDEAAGLDSFALSLLALGDKVIIFGDRRAPVKLNIEVSEEILPENRQKRGFYKSLTDTSLYELIRSVTEPYHLREEFRSPHLLSNIISRMTYNKELKPMRIAEDDAFIPKVLHETYGQLDALRPVNFVEAEETVLLISACLMENEYKDKTFGVISMSEEQAETIFEIAMRRIKPETLEKISFISATSKECAGIERDIVFLSLVDDKDNALNVPTEYELSFAVSRAKEQLFVVHSKKNFKDARRYLFEPALGRREENGRAKTALARELAQNLRDYGFAAQENAHIGSFVLELAILGESPAVIVPIGEEDGEKFDEAFLSRLGWRVIYVRGSKYYRNRKATMESLINTLVENDIKAKEKRGAFGRDLMERVYKNVANLREEYRKQK